MLRQKIGDGAYVTSVPGEKFKRNLLVVHLVVPSERSKVNELALLPHVLERRCASIIDPMALSRKLFDLYGAELSAESYTAGSNRVVTLAVSGLKNEFALAGEDLESAYIELCCALLFEPFLENGAFAKVDVDIERAKQVDYLKSEMNDKRSYCLRQARRALYGDTPLGIESAGYVQEMEAVSREGLFAAYEELLQTAQVEVSCCGLDADKARRGVEKYLGQRKRTPLVPLGRTTVQTPASFIKKSEAMDTAQGKLCLILTNGKKADARTDAVLRMGSALLGGLPTSRLFMNVREKQSLCYYCASSYMPLRGTITLDSGIAHENAERAANAILNEFRDMQKEPVTKLELDRAKLAVRNSFLAAQDSPDTLVAWVFNEQLRETNLSLNEMMALMESLSAEEIQEALCTFTPALQYVLTNKEGA